jgi:hypothetical protein
MGGACNTNGGDVDGKARVKETTTKTKIVIGWIF